jgi:diguanylate cyclase (GGDEF)-like protein/putative nucleotidyltransferase with HDIG domain
MIDLDHFKTVNDTFGHPVGDLVLVETARRIRTAARAGDIVARIGGEEFLMLLPDTDGVTALAVAERVRAAVRATDYPAGAGRLSASLGVASLADELDADGLLAQADAALYWAKRHGRDAAFRYNAALMGDLSVPNRTREIAREDGLAALRALARAIDARDAATQRHSIRVADMAVMIATALGWTADQTIRLREAGLVHDVGKIGIPDSILLKASGLTPDERELMKDHARLGARIVSEVLDPDQVEWVAHHHERWDGDGYPLGIDGTNIPEGARILAVADSWDAMTSAREYNVALGREEALEECVRCSGSQFWPAAIDALVRLDVAGALPQREAPELTAA